MKTSEIREKFLAFFEREDHQRVSSSSLVPAGDKTLLFTNAGMVQFKDVFLGAEKRDYKRATSSQRCVRAGGKHNDLENVGYTARHHTFFEMLGNFSFGDYFKEDAITFAWKFLTEEFGLPPEKLWITVFEEDQEAEDIWLKKIGVDSARLSRIGAHDNFWAMGDTGPCGPCSEIFYDHGEEIEGGPPGTPEEDGDRFIEIWNLVFMQYNRNKQGELKPLPKPSVDTGMGLERMAAVLQGVHNNYEIDLFETLTRSIVEWVEIDDHNNQSVRVIADHIRSCAFLIADGVLPSNEGRGYVLRRIIRRAVRHGRQIGAEIPFFYQIVDPLVKEMGDTYPELAEQASRVKEVLKKEEQRFAETLEQGLKIFDSKMESVSGAVVPGDLAFLLYDTYGFPVDLTADVAREKNLSVDLEGFETLMDQQRERARASSQFDNTDDVELDQVSETRFIGYEQLQGQGKVLAIIADGEQAESVSESMPAQIVMDQTPFYAEGGGQVGDQGTLSNDKGRFEVEDVRKISGDVYLHSGKLVDGSIATGDSLEASVFPDVRARTAANHSATHLLHAALKEVLGDHVEQKGSLVNAHRLRFDFAHGEPVAPEQLRQIETLVNEQVLQNNPVETRVMPIDEARAAGAAALFGEKYGDDVRVVGMSDFSLELCGGTHVERTGSIGAFVLTSESGVAAGVRRVEALTSLSALEYLNQQRDTVRALSDGLRVSTDQLPERVAGLQQKIKDLEKEKKQLQKGGAGPTDLDAQVTDIAGVKALLAKVDGMDSGTMRELIDHYRDKLGDGVVVLVSEADGKARMVAGASKSINKQYPAGKLIQHIAGETGGRGGGRPDMAEGGVPDTGQVDRILQVAKDWIEAGGKVD